MRTVVIVIPEELLERAGVLTPDGRKKAQSEKSDDRRRSDLMKRREHRAKQLDTLQARSVEFRNKVRPKIVAAFGRLDLDDATRVSVDDSVHERNREVINADIGQVINKAKLKCNVTIRPDVQDQLEPYKDDAGVFRGVPEQIARSRASESSTADGVPTVLERVDLVKRYCMDKALPTVCAPIDEAEDTVNSAPTVVEEPITTPTIETIDKEDIPRYVAQLLPALSDSEGASAVTGEARHTIATLQDSLNTFALEPGPADTPAYYDFEHLHIAFDHVWQEAIDEDMISDIERIYDSLFRPDSAPDLVWWDDPQQTGCSRILAQIEVLKRQIEVIAKVVHEPVPADIARVFDVSQKEWEALYSDVAEENYRDELKEFLRTWKESGDPFGINARRTLIEGAARILVARIAGPRIRQDWDIVGKWRQQIEDLKERAQQHYPFTIYAANCHERSVNFGVLLTYRQKWQPVTYQAGELRRTITLAPKESRKISRTTKVNRKRMQKETEKHISSLKHDSSEKTRAESEIISKAHFATNFSLSTDGSIKVGPYEGTITSKFGGDASRDSSETKKSFREAVVKAAQELKDERTMEIVTEETFEEEFTESGEIVNPNEELAVTFLFYELQRRYKLAEQLHRAQGVILVAQEVPQPHEITNDWLVRHDWILSRVMLDDSFLPAFEFLMRMKGDRVGLRALKDNVEAQRDIVKALRDELVLVKEQAGRHRLLLEHRIYGKPVLTQKKSGGGTWWGKITDAATDVVDLMQPVDEVLEASGQAVEAVGDALGGFFGKDDAGDKKLAAAQELADRATKDYKDLMAKLDREVTALYEMTEKFTKAKVEHENRKKQIGRLKTHIRQNILHYMKAIWNHEPEDQRFFRLHKVKVPVLEGKTFLDFSGKDVDLGTAGMTHPIMGAMLSAEASTVIEPPLEEQDLVEVADLDNLLGFKGNYMIFPLKKSNALTTFMMQPYLHDSGEEFLHLRDPDTIGNISLEDFSEYVCCLCEQLGTEQLDELRPELQKQYEALLTSPLRENEEIVVPTESLFIEALPGEHPLLEDFKLRHRAIDVKKVEAEVRQHELDNIRRAARILGGQYDDPDIASKYVFEGSGSPVIAPNAPVGDDI